MKLLAIDTSSKYLSLAVSDGLDIILQGNYLLDRKHSNLLIPKIDALLKRVKLDINDINGFILGLGPGSFTGLRIGVSTVKGFGISTGKPCIGVPSIDAIAMNKIKINGYDYIVPIIDAKRGQVYSCIYRIKEEQVIRESGYLLLPIEELMEKIRHKAVFTGDGIGLYREKILALNNDIEFLDEKYWYPKAGSLIKLGYKKIKDNKKQDLSKLEPLYIYPKDCQVR